MRNYFLPNSLTHNSFRVFRRQFRPGFPYPLLQNGRPNASTGDQLEQILRDKKIPQISDLNPPREARL